MLTKTVGIVLIVIGIIMIVYTGFNYVTTEKVALHAQIGDLSAVTQHDGLTGFL